MTNALATSKPTRVLLLIAGCIVALAFVQWGPVRGSAALIGAALSLVNWFALRWFTARLVYGPAEHGSRKALVSLLLIGKIGVLIAVVYLLIQHLRVDPVGLAFGLGVLFIGPIVASLVSGAASLHPSAASAAREER